MPVYQFIGGERFNVYGNDARFVAMCERDLLRNLQDVQEEIKHLIEAIPDIVREGHTFDADPQIREELANAAAAIAGFYDELPKPKLRAAGR